MLGQPNGKQIRKEILRAVVRYYVEEPHDPESHMKLSEVECWKGAADDLAKRRIQNVLALIAKKGWINLRGQDADGNYTELWPVAHHMQDIEHAARGWIKNPAWWAVIVAGLSLLVSAIALWRTFGD